MRNLTKTIAAVSILAPANAYSLGIGDIKLHSALNQKLDAEIKLHLSGDEKPSDLRIKIAPPEKFDELGISWNYFLSKIKFETKVKRNGSVVIKLSSQEVLREPFLDFLMEVTWAKGSLYREFTVLVDPPAGYAKPTVPVIEKAKQTPQREQVYTQSRYQRPQKRNKIVEGKYGPTGMRDSLWKIAERTNNDPDIAIEQMMMAIFKLNPQAFYKDNVNALKAGYTLDIPDKSKILKLSRKQARQAFKEQVDIWEGRVSKRKHLKASSGQESGINAQLELQAPKNANVAGTDLDTAKSGVTDEGSKMKPSSQEDQALQEKLQTLEQQLNVLQQMLALKDQQIAALQNQTQGQSTIDETAKKSPTESTISKTEPQSAQSTTAPVTEDTVTPVKKEIPAAAAVSKTPEKAAEKPKTATKKAEKPEQKTTTTSQPKAQSGFFSDTLSWIIGLFSLIILAILGFLFWRQRKINEETEAESMFASASEISLPDSTAEELSVPLLGEDSTSSYDVGTVGESSFLSEFTPSDFDAFDTENNDVDPTSEADVYLAYGRYQQAEDLMRQAIKDQPDKDECKLKLLEIFHANENKSAFEEYAQQLVNEGKHNDQEFWTKVVDMGSELLPASALFTSPSQSSEETSESQQTETDIADLDLENDQQVSDSDSNEIDFDLTAYAEDNTEAKPAIDENSLDFDLSVFDAEETNEEQEASDTPQTSDKNTIESIDFDLNSMALDSTAAEPENKPAEESTDDALDNLDFSLESPKTDAISDNAPVDDIESIEDFDFDFDMEVEAPESEPTVSLADLDDSVSDLTDMDELETKIDLAKAYIDMGDVEAAKGIAEEVLEKGTEEQKEEARSIMNQLK